MKPLVIYHANCADGFGAAFAAWLKLGDEAEYVPMQYGEIDFDFEGGFFNLGSHEADNPCTFIAGRQIYILDFSFPRPVMDAIFRNAKRVVWLDHHKTAFEMWCGGIPEDGTYMCSIGGIDQGHFIRLHNEKSGAILAWEYFHPGTEVPMFIHHIDDYDRWQFKMEGTKAFNKALWSKPFDFNAWKIVFLTPGYEMNAYHFMYREGEAILRAHDQNVQSVVKGGVRKCSIVPAVINSSDSYKAPWVWWHDEEFGDTCGVNGLSANCPPHLTSDVGHELANQSGTFGLLWSIDKDNRCKCSLRSNGDYDVSAIAKAFGGGGHRNAAGFTVDIQTLLGWIK